MEETLKTLLNFYRRSREHYHYFICSNRINLLKLLTKIKYIYPKRFKIAQHDEDKIDGRTVLFPKRKKKSFTITSRDWIKKNHGKGETDIEIGWSAFSSEESRFHLPKNSRSAIRAPDKGIFAPRSADVLPRTGRGSAIIWNYSNQWTLTVVGREGKIRDYNGIVNSNINESSTPGVMSRLSNREPSIATVLTRDFIIH